MPPVKEESLPHNSNEEATVRTDLAIRSAQSLAGVGPPTYPTTAPFDLTAGPRDSIAALGSSHLVAGSPIVSSEACNNAATSWTGSNGDQQRGHDRAELPKNRQAPGDLCSERSGSTECKRQRQELKASVAVASTAVDDHQHQVIPVSSQQGIL